MSIPKKSKENKDMVILTQLQAMRPGKPKNIEPQERRPRTRNGFHFKSFRICKSFWLFGTIFFKLKTLINHLNENGLTPTIHGLTKSLPHNTTSIDHKYIVNFLEN